MRISVNRSISLKTPSKHQLRQARAIQLDDSAIKTCMCAFLSYGYGIVNFILMP